MTDIKDVRERYLEVWNEDDPVARLEFLRLFWTDDATYVDPMMSGEGAKGISDMIGSARSSFPGHRFDPRGAVDGHGPFVRFSWTLSADGTAAALGTDVVRLADDGRVAEVVGFLDPS